MLSSRFLLGCYEMGPPIRAYLRQPQKFRENVRHVACIDDLVFAFFKVCNNFLWEMVSVVDDALVEEVVALA